MKVLNELKKGLMIPKKVLEMDDLDIMEKNLLALYVFFTKEYEGCLYTNKEIADFFGVSEHSIKRYKSQLSSLGYIKVKGRLTVVVEFLMDSIYKNR